MRSWIRFLVTDGLILASAGLLAVSLVVGGVPLLKGIARLGQLEES